MTTVSSVPDSRPDASFDIYRCVTELVRAAHYAIARDPALYKRYSPTELLDTYRTIRVGGHRGIGHTHACARLVRDLSNGTIGGHVIAIVPTRGMIKPFLEKCAKFNGEPHCFDALKFAQIIASWDEPTVPQETEWTADELIGGASSLVIDGASDISDVLLEKIRAGIAKYNKHLHRFHLIQIG
jgi:hypothetical protein